VEDRVVAWSAPLPHILQTLLLLAFPAGVIAAALTDATSYLIPNRVSAGLAVAFVPAALACGLPTGVFAACLGVGVVAFLAGVVLFALKIMGGGDAKLMAACMVWLGLPAAMPFLLWTAVAGGVLALTLMGARRVPLVATAGPAWMGRLLQPGGDVPYGIAIAVGALAAFPSSPLVQIAHAF
jgi:prepilin peptidase CpaA